MAFVNEIVSNEGMEFLKSFHFPTPLGCGSGEWIEHYFHFGSTKWLIDKERDIVFITLCGQGHRFDRQYPPTYHYLIWKGQPIEVESYRKGYGNNNIGIKVVWEIESIVIPSTLNVSGDSVIDTLKEVITAYEGRDGANLISVEFAKIIKPIVMNGPR